MSKYHRGDKFIIEIGEKHTHYDDNNKPFALYRIKGFSSLVFDDKGLNKLERYTQDRISKNTTLYAKLFLPFKYQVSLNIIKDFFLKEGASIDDVAVKKVLDNLQELINEYAKLLNLISDVESDFGWRDK